MSACSVRFSNNRQALVKTAVPRLDATIWSIMEQAATPASEGDRQAKRYYALSRRYIDNAMVEVACGRWKPAEDLLWGSVVAAVKAVAWSRGEPLQDNAQVEEYTRSLGQQMKDRRIRDAFSRLSGYATMFDRLHDSPRENTRRLVMDVEEVAAAVQRLWRLLPSDESGESREEESLER